MCEFVNFSIAKKLKEKGFRCKHPIAMYNEDGMFCPLYTSAGHNEDVRCIFGNREYYDYDNFDSRDFIAPTISQVLKWLREEKEIFIRVTLSYDYSTDADGEQVDRWTFWLFEVFSVGSGSLIYTEEISEYDSYEQAAIAGIEYCLDNLI